MTECNKYFKNSLFLVGEIGGNDINAIIPYKNITELREMVPPIVGAIILYQSFVNLNFNNLIKLEFEIWWIRNWILILFIFARN